MKEYEKLFKPSTLSADICQSCKKKITGGMIFNHGFKTWHWDCWQPALAEMQKDMFAELRKGEK